MPNLATLLKEEISKLARKEVQDQMRTFAKDIKEQDARIARLEKQGDQPKAKTKAKAKAKAKADQPAPAEEAAAAPAPKRNSKTRFSPASLKTNRKRLNLSQADVGILLGTSTNTVLRWEAGSSKPRGVNLPKIAELSKLGKKEAKQRLEQLKDQAGE